MATGEVVTIGCRLPNGYMLEVGLKVTETVSLPGGGTGTVARVLKTEQYARFKLKGTNESSKQAFRLSHGEFMPPSKLRPPPEFTRNVPKDFWEQWKKEHPKNGALKRNEIFEVKAGQSNEQAATLDAMSTKGVLEPLEKGAIMKFGDATIQKYEADKE